MKRRRLLPHASRLGLIGGSCLALTTGCGPMPGLVIEPPPKSVGETDDDPASARPAQRSVMDQRTDQDNADTDEDEDDVKIVRLKGADTYYLLDRRRGLCFMHHRDTMTGVDCHKLPEAEGFIDAQPDAGEADEADDEAATERARYGSDDGVVRRTAPGPDQLVSPPAPGSSVTVTPLPAPSSVRKAPAPKEAPAVTTPSARELTHFEAAYFDVFCDRRAGGEIAPKTRIEAQGLSVERYTEIEGWWASDQDSWWQLTNKARRACK